MLWNYFCSVTVCRLDEFITVVFILQYRQLINKGNEFIDLHSIFKDKSVISSVPNNLNIQYLLQFAIKIKKIY